ncbi:MAG: hypothetical protein KDD69_07435 [Bdellovibrionales bacterium]|nr:hypothetical protein [Bdellovibrionales bacterium]
MSSQLNFDLQPAQPFSLSYFVPHSGVVQAYTLLENTVERLAADQDGFNAIYLYGPSGSGKRHLAFGFQERAAAKGIPNDAFRIVLLPKDPALVTDDFVREVIGSFEQCRARGGLFLAVGEHAPKAISSNPHLTSRLLSGSVTRLQYPQEEELRPLLASLSERRNLRLSQRSLDYLVRRIPSDPLSFDRIFDKISQISLAEGRPAKLGVVRQALE